jgi:hypothetical protein
MLVPIEYPERLKSPAEAAAFYRALGERSVALTGGHTRDLARVGRYVDAIVPNWSHTISFQSGTLDFGRLEALALATGFHYFDLATTEAVLRIWPALYAWVYPNRQGVTTEKFENIAGAVARFREMTGRELRRGFINGVQEPTKPLLLDFLRHAHAEVDVTLTVEPERGAELTEPEVEFEWQAAELIVDFPGGRVNGFLVTPNVGEEFHDAWQRRVADAFTSMNRAPTG